MGLMTDWCREGGGEGVKGVEGGSKRKRTLTELIDQITIKTLNPKCRLY
jgi:hypothetical protein